MKVKFQFPRCVGGKDYSKGVHDIEDNHKDHWFFKGLVANGDVVIVEHGKSSELTSAVSSVSPTPDASESKKPEAQAVDEIDQDEEVESEGDSSDELSEDIDDLDEDFEMVEDDQPEVKKPAAKKKKVKNAQSHKRGR